MTIESDSTSAQVAATDYCEEDQIAYTIQRWYPNLFSEFESQVRSVQLLRAKAKAYNWPEMPPPVVEWIAGYDIAAIDAALAEGYMPFLRRTARRIMLDCPGDVVLNRCSLCRRVVGTPMAKWCKWCKHDWH